MKKYLCFWILSLIVSECAMAQSGGIRIPGKKNSQGLNLLDDPKFKKAPINFVPLVPDVRRGYDPEKIYTWSDPGNPRKKYSAKGKDILAQVNEVERSLNERGHSLREKKPFIQLNLTLPQIQKNDLSNCIITNRLNKSIAVGGFGKTGANTPGIPNTIPKPFLRGRRMPPVRAIGDITYTYTGTLITNAAEFKSGTFTNTSQIEWRNGTPYAKLMMGIPAALWSKAASCKMDLSQSEGGPVITSVQVNIKSPESTVALNGGYNIEYADCEKMSAYQAGQPFRVYSVNLAGSGYQLPAAGKKEQFYFATIRFFDAGGNVLNTYQPNSLAFNNQLPFPINIASEGNRTYNGFNYELLDPGIHAFGFFANSGGFNSKYYYTGIMYDGVKKSAAVSGDMRVGLKYFNFKHLVNSSEPLSEEFILFGYKFNSEENYYKGDGMPGIRRPGGRIDPDYGIVTLLNKEFDLSKTDKTYFSETVTQHLTGFRFFIGPIPCSINVNVDGTVSMTVNYQSSSACDIKTTFTPRAEVNLTASGGIDAFDIAYAKIVAGINLITMEMPYTLEANANDKVAVINPVLTVGGLSGQIYFQAGLCIPIPFVDDICTDFRVDILNWNGLQKSLKIDPAKGISL
ncbi:hypothetical protein HHL16_22880 [Pseudoflavitalea sp. G-6-1-2]|uniref:hypothetical protein n=1 Tax=Pseudoflavitalea sp. G-6-1-2 TaxID=2728841 RepID=UPI00146B56EB|nr:hypothetical protein [Pseudoflavitalea sp. G-6-1-2]NML23744.1 hypothetical protein [Pseudoflavitalea sp. G-6-1-2]